MDVRQYDNAINYFGSTLEHNKGMARAYYYRGVMHYRKRDLDKALRDMRTATILLPHFGQGWEQRCRLEALTGRTAAALESCRRALRLAGSSAKRRAQAHRLRAVLHGRMGGRDAAEVDYALALRLARETLADTDREPDQSADGIKKRAEALGDVSWFALFARNYEMAWDASDKAAALKPSLLWPRTNRAHAVMFQAKRDQSKYAEARRIYLERRGECIGEGLWDDLIKEDFAVFRDHGLIDEQDQNLNRFVAEIESALNASS